MDQQVIHDGYVVLFMGHITQDALNVVNLNLGTYSKSHRQYLIPIMWAPKIGEYTTELFGFRGKG